MARKAMNAQGVERERERILAQAQRLVEIDGFKYLSMRKLAAGLGVTATTIYRYFSSKDDLFLSLLVTGFGRLYEGIATRAGEAAGATEKLKAAGDEYLRFGIEEKGYYGMMFASDYPECKEYSDPREAATSQEAMRVSMCVAGLFGELVAQAAGRPVSQERILQAWIVMHGFVSLYNSGVFEHMIGNVAGLREATVRQAMDIALAP